MPFHSASNLSTTLGNKVPAPLASAIGRSDRAKRLLRPVVNAATRDCLQVVSVRSGNAAGINMEIYPRSEKYYWTGTYEEDIQAILLKQLRPGDVFWDIGAHIGYFSLLAAHLVGSAGVVYSFEPLPDNVARLTRNVAMNGLDNIRVLDVAVASQIGVVQFEIAASSTMGYLVDGLNSSSSLFVATTTIDDCCERIGVPNLVKIDAEGAEVSVLMGGQELVNRHSASFLIEVHSALSDESVRNLLPGYFFARISPRHLFALPAQFEHAEVGMFTR